MEEILGVFEQHLDGYRLDQAFCEALASVMPLREVAIFDYHPAEQRLVCRFAPGLPDDEVEELAYDLGQDLCGTAALSAEVVKAFGSRRNGKNPALAPRVAIPLLAGRQCIGVLEICRDSKDPGFSPEELSRVRTAALLYAQRRMLESAHLARAPKAPDRAIGEAPLGLGRSSAYERTQRLLLRAAPSNCPILIQGETGTGKELCARQIHEASLRKRKPYVVINCASLSESHLESELFGHVRGAYTGAIRNRPGKLREAEGGTVFLDEVAEIDPVCQSKLLRTLDSGEITPLGSDKVHHVDVRFIAATNDPLDRLVERGAFREDLFFRLRGMLIELPPLRDRRGDLDLLAAYFLENERPPGRTDPRGFDPSALDLMRAYTWPGNIRELRQAVITAALLAEGPFIRVQDLPSVILETMLQATPSKPSNDDVHDEHQALIAALRETAYPMTGRWNIAAAARRLGIPRTTLEYRVRILHNLRER